MQKRYAKNAKGKIVKIADIYQPEEHNINTANIDREVFQISRRLEEHGYEAYLVGGAVRDLMLQRKPKDFDIVTDARPQNIQKLFRNSRIIGKRFRLVHIFYPEGKIIEIVTFRSLESQDHNHIYGSIEEDVQRRDFTVNTFYYHISNGHLLDFTDGMGDFKKQRIRNVIPLSQIFKEDPVRLIRCVKYAAITGFKIPMNIGLQIQRNRKLLTESSSSRLAEELNKILLSDRSYEICKALLRHRLFSILLPILDPKQFPPAYKTALEENLKNWQDRLAKSQPGRSKAAPREAGRKHREKSPRPLPKYLFGESLAYLFKAYFEYRNTPAKLRELESEEASLQLYQSMKESLLLNIPNAEVNRACKELMGFWDLPYSPHLILKHYNRLRPRHRRGPSKPKK